MKTQIHPEYTECSVTCSCGNQFVTHATVPELRVELCAACHPFYTGKQKLVDTGGRVERFTRRYAQQEPTPESAGTEAPPKRKKRAEAPKPKAPVSVKGGPRPKYEPVRDESRDGRGGRGGPGGRGGGRDAGRGGRGRADAHESRAPEASQEKEGSADAPVAGETPDAAAAESTPSTE